jgi:hypothetical protein
MGKFVVINATTKLSKKDFLDVLETWEIIYFDLLKTDFKNNKMTAGLMRVAASFYVIEELVNSAAAYRVLKASQIASSGDRTRIDEVYELLREIKQIITA